MPNSFIIKAASVLAGVCLSFVIAELILRSVHPQITISSLKPAYFFKCYRTDPYLYLKLKANQNCRLSSNMNAFKDIDIRTNSLGLRNSEITSEKDPKVQRILFLGDSFTLGWGVEEKDTYVRRVDFLLQKDSKSKESEVINAGVNATGPIYDYIYLKKEGLLLNPDTVVVGFYPWNDILYDIQSSEIITKYDTEGYPDTVDSRNSYVDYTGVLRQKNLPLRLKIPILRSLNTFSLFANAAFPLQVKSENDLLPTISSPFLLVCLFKRNCDDLNEAKSTTKNIFLSMKKLSDKNNVRLIVVIIPAEFQIYNDVNPKYRLPIPLLPSEKRYLNEEFTDFFKQNQIEYIDLLPTFQKNTKKRMYFKHDSHWNEQGHELAATAIKQALLKNPE